jgi:Domain of unknown function (DUF4347)
MTDIREILFVDPAIADIATISDNLRPGVEAFVLDAAVPAARQIAAVLTARRGLAAVHVIAHGAPGRVNFAAGDWSAATLDDEADDLAAIGRALAAHGDLRLWSCDTGAGPAGAVFVEHLVQATGAGIAAASGRVGAAALGGSWELTAAARPPLTAAGIARYAGVLISWRGPTPGTAGDPNSGNWNTGANWGTGVVPAAGDDVFLDGTAGSGYTVTLDTTTAALDSLTVEFSNGTNFAIFAVGSQTVNVTGTGTGATDTLTLSGDNQITIAGGTINAGALALSSSTGQIFGFGSLSVTGSTTGTGTIEASGGALNISGTVASGPTFLIDSSTTSQLELHGTATSAAAISINNANQTLGIGTSGNLTIGAAEIITNGTIQLGTGTLTVAAGLTIGSGATLSGHGSVAAPLTNNSGGTIADTGGTLSISSGVANSGLISIANSANISSTSTITQQYRGHDHRCGRHAGRHRRHRQ